MRRRYGGQIDVWDGEVEDSSETCTLGTGSGLKSFESAYAGLSDRGCGRGPDAVEPPAPGPRRGEKNYWKSQESENPTAGMSDVRRGRRPGTEGETSSSGLRGVRQGESGIHQLTASRNVKAGSGRSNSPFRPTRCRRGKDGKQRGCDRRSVPDLSKTGGLEDGQRRYDRHRQPSMSEGSGMRLESCS